jgi:hypothetical protein
MVFDQRSSDLPGLGINVPIPFPRRRVCAAKLACQLPKLLQDDCSEIRCVDRSAACEGSSHCRSGWVHERVILNQSTVLRLRVSQGGMPFA